MPLNLKPLLSFLLLFMTGLAFPQGQMLPPSFRIPDNKMPQGFYTKEMSDTFSIKPSKPQVTPFDPSTINTGQNQYYNSRNEGAVLAKKTELKIGDPEVPSQLKALIASEVYAVWQTTIYRIESSKEYDFKTVYQAILQKESLRKSIVFSIEGLKISETDF